MSHVFFLAFFLFSSHCIKLTFKKSLLFRCKFAKIDLILILDASTSRESVFEHQRELALSLIERLPISRGDTHVSIGLNSFVHVPTMRLTLGLGRDRTVKLAFL
jgi:hypothetical protein